MLEVPVAPSMRPALDASHFPQERRPIERRIVVIVVLSVLIGIVSGFAAQLLVRLINLVTALSFHGTLSDAPSTPLGN
ncbi:MAG TPA: chloride channel protein, partial [Myxococcales bacterium]